MPFTVSHIAFALPIKKYFHSKISTTGLVIGSMLPDIEYYLRMTMYGTWGHTWKGILGYEVPIGIILAYIFHLLIRDQLIVHLPQRWSSRAAEYIDFDWNQYFKRNWLSVICSMYIGIITHMLLDIVTHSPGYIFGIGAEVLNTNILNIALYNWNQMYLSLLGLGLLLWVILKQPIVYNSKKIAKSTRSKLYYWALFLLCFICIYTIRILVGIPTEKLIIQHMVIVCSAASISILLTSISVRYFKKIAPLT